MCVCSMYAYLHDGTVIYLLNKIKIAAAHRASEEEREGEMEKRLVCFALLLLERVHLCWLSYRRTTPRTATDGLNRCVMARHLYQTNFPKCCSMHTEKVIVNPILMDENRQREWRWRPTQPNKHRIKFRAAFVFGPFLKRNEEKEKEKNGIANVYCLWLSSRSP